MESQLSYAPDWHRDAPCREVGTEAFFTDEDDSAGDAANLVRTAKAFCVNTCPVIDECLLSALKARDEFGIFGGTSARDRREMLAGRKPLPAWADERHQRVVGAEAGPEWREGNVTNLKRGRVGDEGRQAAIERRTELVERVEDLTREGYTGAVIGEMLGVTKRSVERYRRIIRERQAA